MRHQSDEWLLYGAATCLLNGGHGRMADDVWPGAEQRVWHSVRPKLPQLLLFHRLNTC
jgi:hypothetical protein